MRRCCFYEIRTWVVKTFSSIQLFSHVQLFATPYTAAHQAFLSITNTWSLLKLMYIEPVMPSNHLILCCPLYFLPSVFPSIRVFSNGQFIKRLFSSSSLSAIRVVSSAYLRLLIFLPAILISVCASSSLAFHMMYFACIK